MNYSCVCQDFFFFYWPSGFVAKVIKDTVKGRSLSWIFLFLIWMNLIHDFAGLFFPEVCYSCGNSLFKGEKIVCTRCFLHLPETKFHKDPDNPVSQVFWGRIPLQAATSLYYYKKGGSVQNLIHQLKYNGHKEIGIYLGTILGSEINHIDQFKDIDCILPVPLHRKKLKTNTTSQENTS